METYKAAIFDPAFPHDELLEDEFQKP